MQAETDHACHECRQIYADLYQAEINQEQLQQQWCAHEQKCKPSEWQVDNSGGVKGDDREKDTAEETQNGRRHCDRNGPKHANENDIDKFRNDGEIKTHIDLLWCGLRSYDPRLSIEPGDALAGHVDDDHVKRARQQEHFEGFVS